MHAYRKGRARLVIFDNVDVTVAVERVVEGQKVPVPYIVRAANRKSFGEIDAEITAARTGRNPQSGAMPWLPLWLFLPAFVRRRILIFLWAIPTVER